MKMFEILINISLKFVPNSPINNIQALVQIKAWGHPGDKLLSEQFGYFTNAYLRHLVSMS